MKLLLFAFFATVFFRSHLTYAAAEQVVAFDDLPKLIKERNENVQAAEASVKAANSRTGSLVRSFLPQISATAGAEQFESGSSINERENFWVIQGRVNLFRGGKDRLESQIRKSNMSRSRTEYLIETGSELKEARKTFWALIAVVQVIADRKEALEKNESFIKGARRRSGAGVSTNADTIQFELHKTMLNQELKKLKLEQDLLKNRLSVALGMDDHEGLKLKGDFQHPPDEIGIPAGNARENLEVQNLTEIQKVNSLARKQASRWWLPQVDVYSKFGVPTLEDEFSAAIRQEREFTLGVAVTIDLGQGLDSRVESNAKTYEALASEKRAALRLREVKAADRVLRQDLKLLHELVHDSDNDIKKAEEFLKLTQSEHGRGVKNGPDLLGAFQKLYEFRERRTSLYKEYYETHAELAALTGQ